MQIKTREHFHINISKFADTFRRVALNVAGLQYVI